MAKTLPQAPSAIPPGTAQNTAQPSSTRQRTRIRPSRGWRALDLREVWRYRELVFILAWRDVQVRYKQTVLGVAWALLQPFVAMVIFTVFFGHLIGVSSDGVPYPLFAYAGLLPWTYFANAATNSSESLVANANLISKVYFPRLVIPLAGVGSGLVDLAIGFGLFILLLVAFGVSPTPRLVLLPLLVVVVILAALSVGIWLSALNVQYRDVRYAIPFLIQVWMFATPVVYPASIVPAEFRPLYGLNPIAGVVEGFRWALLGSTDLDVRLLGVSLGIILVMLVSGLFYFRRMERNFADVV
jgi:lipopolysaccharide transport system permease protein